MFWPNIDPLTANRQFCDHGSQYRSAIFYHDSDQEHLAHGSKMQFAQSGRFRRSDCDRDRPRNRVLPAEEYHQTTTRKTRSATGLPFRCGRDRALKEVWGDRK